MRKILTRVAQGTGWIPDLCVVVALLGIGWWGHRSHWKFVAAEGADAHSAESRSERSDLKRGIVMLQDDQTAHELGLRLATAERSSIEERISANGVITYDQTQVAQLSARAAGTVWRVEKRVGQEVKKGEVLAILDAVDVGRAKAELLQAIVEFDHREIICKRLEAVKDAISQRTVREAEAKCREAKFRLFNAQQALRNLGFRVPSSDLERLSDDELSQRVYYMGLPPSIIASLDPSEATANLIPIIAPFDGIVIGRDIAVGEVVQPSQPQITIADVRTMWLELDVRREDASRLALGQTVTFAIDGYPGELRSSITWISTEVDEKTRTVQARADVENPLLRPGDKQDGQRLLRAHSFVTARIRVRNESEAVVVPTAAVQWDDDHHVVFLPQIDGSGYVRRTVQTGVSRDGMTEVIRGLSPGEQVVATGSHVLKSELARLRYAGASP